jgi:hypothetical protein
VNPLARDVEPRAELMPFNPDHPERVGGGA